MAENSKIEWTDATWNIITGCTLIDEGCRHCYAAHLITSWPALGNHPSRKGLARKNAAGESKFTGEVRFNEEWLDQPLRWKKPRKIFVCAHGDLFHEAVPDEWLDKVFAVMALCPQHTFQVLTKRPARARDYLLANPGIRIRTAMQMIKPVAIIEMVWPLPNVWLGTSISDQASADRRIPHLLAVPAEVRFLSMEPLIGPVDIEPWLHYDDCAASRRTSRQHGESPLCHCGERKGPGDFISWVIVGGESGPHARPMHSDWARSLRDQCAAAGVPFLFKQWGEWAHMLHMAGVTAVSNAPAKDGYYAHPARYRIHGGPYDGQCFESHMEDHLLMRVGKSRAGRLLDGVEHNGFPVVSK